MNMITTAASAYAFRPADTRIATVQDMIDQATADREQSKEIEYNWKDLRAVPNGPAVALQSPKGQAHLTHWSFGQMAKSIGAPAGYLRGLPPELAADCINHGIQHGTEIGERAKILIRLPDTPGDLPTARACTSDTYGRAWDSRLITEARRNILQYTTSNGQWQNAPTWAGEEIAGFRSDRDSFLMQIDGGSIVNDPSVANGDGRMYRGFIMKNSEVGASSVSLMMILFRFICGNWNLWGAVMQAEYTRRHVGKHVTSDTISELAKMSRAFVNRPASADEDLIRQLISREIAHTEAGVIDELRKTGLTKEQAKDAYARCQQTENASPRSFWGIAQGITRMSQDSGYQDARYDLDQLAAAVLARGRALVAA